MLQQIDVYVLDQVKMKNKIKTMMMMGIIVLLITIIPAREYNFVDNNFNKTRITYYSDLLDKNITQNFESELSYDKIKYGTYENYIQSKMDENELMRYNYTAWLETYQSDEIILVNEEEVGTGYLIGLIRKIAEWLGLIDKRVDYLEGELCKKDSSYGFCKEVTP